MQLENLKPFREHAEARRLALVFAVVYFAQGMWYLPNLPITFLLKDSLGLGAGQTATFFAITTVPWLIKPIYGLISDFVPLWGQRRRSYLILTSGAAALMGLILTLPSLHTYWSLATFFTLMGLGLAFTDVLADALMVENGQRLGLTGSFQAIQWAAISLASILVGIGGGWLAEQKWLSLTFLIAAIFPLVTLAMGIWIIQEPGEPHERGFRETWDAIRGAIESRTLWVVAGFIFFYNFSPSFGPALVYYGTDVLGFSKLFIGMLDSLAYASGILGSVCYFAFSKSLPFKYLIHFAIAAGVVATLAYLGYRSEVSAISLSLVFGAVAMFIQLIFLDLAAKACPKRVEATFFALLMSIYNGAVQLSQITGGWLYDKLGFTPLIFTSAAFTALCWLLVPLLKLDNSLRAHDGARAERAVS
ncbi:MAG TPA: MFS transporter [Candidatus Binatia bacterium]|nr:MFS transporter [Candidatus Binatia bacterium]